MQPVLFLNSIAQVFLQALTPLKYLRINTKNKRVFDVVMPLIFAMVLSAIMSNQWFMVRMFGETGFIDKTVDLFGVLVGFFITALSVVATFQTKALDQKPISEMTMRIQSISGEYKVKRLTRREFLCYLFGYLAVMSLGLFLTGAIVGAAEESLKLVAASSVYARPVLAFLYVFIICHLLSITCLGIYYFVERIHQPDVTQGPPQITEDHKID